MKTLIIGPSWVGDMMMSQSLYRTLKSHSPAMTIDVMAPAWCSAVLNKMPEVNQALTLPLTHGEFALSKRYQLGKQLQAAKYDLAIVLPNSFKSALIPYFAKIPQRRGWRGEMRYGLLNDIRTLDKTAFPLMVQRYVALAYPKSQIHSAADLEQPLLRPKLQVSQTEIQQTMAQFQLPNNQSLIAFCPGAEFGPAKCWPDYHYAALADKLIEQGKQVVIFGSPNDLKVAQLIVSKAKHAAQIINLAGLTTLEQAVTLLAACQAVVSNDSGLLHIAAALDCAVLALYGPTTPDFTPPLTDKAATIKLNQGLHKRVRRGEGEDGYHQSMIDITPELAFESLTNLLARSE